MYQDNQSILPCFGDLLMMQACVEWISENLDHSISFILKDAICDVTSPLLRFSLFIDASTSDGSMDGGVNARRRCSIITQVLVS